MIRRTISAPPTKMERTPTPITALVVHELVCIVVSFIFGWRIRFIYKRKLLPITEKPSFWFTFAKLWVNWSDCRQYRVSTSEKTRFPCPCRTKVVNLGYHIAGVVGNAHPIRSLDRTLQLLFVANIGINLRLVAVGVLVIKCLQEVKRRFRQTMAASICY